MIRSILVANRGEIACRVFRTCKKLGIATIAVYSDADVHARHVAMADRAFRLGPAPVSESYLRADRILAAASSLGADAIHPGYGFLSENAEFARQVMAAGCAWIGPPPAAIEAMGDKVAARRTVRAAGVPIVPGSDGVVADLDEALRVAESIGYPVMLKPSGGGGGIGMVTVHSSPELRKAFASSMKQAERYFSNPAVYLEKYVVSARHIEVQILGLNDGTMLAIGDRDCSVQRRHQKVFEEAPAPGLGDDERDQLHGLACRIAAAIDYRGAGTVEMILDRESRDLYFLEMNTRLQVEHPVTEMVTGIDLVAAQIAIAGGRDPELPSVVVTAGHAVELRVCAESADRFLPSPGRITAWVEPVGPDIRVDSGYREGDEITPYYDSLMAKLCAWGQTRSEALDRLRRAAAGFRIEGPKTTLAVAERLISNPLFRSNAHDTSILTRINQTTRTRQG